MKIQVETRPLEAIQADALVLFAFDKKAPREPAFAALGGGWVGEVYESGEFAGKLLEFAILPRPHGLAASRLVLAGCGDPERFHAAEARQVAAAAVRTVRSKACRSIALALAPRESPEFASALVEGALLGDYEPDQYKTGDRKETRRLESFAVAGADAEELRPATETGEILAEAQNFARDLANEPSNVLTPGVLAERAAGMAAAGLACEVLDETHMRDLGMGALLGVAQGSHMPPRLIVVRYVPPPGQQAASGGGAHLALVGKAVTFDSGGISIKPSEGMEKMKYDMCGGAAVLGAMQAIARLRPALQVTGIVPAVENMVGGRAQRPGDIVTTMSGKTVEVLNTDAEGRLILVDAFTYAKQQGATHLVDVATLTGAIVVALAGVNTGVFTNNDDLQQRVLEAARRAGEKMWPMPLDDEYRDMLKSAFADIPNISGGRWGGASTAAAFLREFVEDLPWVHLDIAGTAYLDDAKPFAAKGPTGVTVRTLVGLARLWR